MRKALKIAGVVLGVLVLALVLWKMVADARYFSGYDPKAPLNARVAETVDTDGYTRIKFYFDGEGGDPVPTLMTLPLKYSGKLPLILFLHGIGQHKEFLDEITTPFNAAGFAMACFDQHMQGERKIRTKNPLAHAAAFRARPHKTINDARRLMDYLENRPEIDPRRIYLVGASYGAITGSTLTAFDKRIRASVLVYGGGDINKLLDAPVIVNGFKKAAPGWLFPIAKTLVGFIMRPADPIRYADQIAPTPVLFQNGRKDQLVAPPAAEALQQAAREPKQVTWYNSDHIGMDDAVVRQVLEEDLQWLLEKDKPFRQEASVIRPAA